MIVKLTSKPTSKGSMRELAPICRSRETSVGQAGLLVVRDGPDGLEYWDLANHRFWPVSDDSRHPIPFLQAKRALDLCGREQHASLAIWLDDESCDWSTHPLFARFLPDANMRNEEELPGSPDSSINGSSVNDGPEYAVAGTDSYMRATGTEGYMRAQTAMALLLSFAIGDVVHCMKPNDPSFSAVKAVEVECMLYAQQFSPDLKNRWVELSQVFTGKPRSNSNKAAELAADAMDALLKGNSSRAAYLAARACMWAAKTVPEDRRNLFLQTALESLFLATCNL